MALAGGSLLCLYGAHAWFALLVDLCGRHGRSRSDTRRVAFSAGGLQLLADFAPITVQKTPPCVQALAALWAVAVGLAHTSLRSRRNPEALHFRPAFMSLNHRGTRRAS